MIEIGSLLVCPLFNHEVASPIISLEFTAKIEGLLLLFCGYLSFIVGNLQVIIQLYRSSTMNPLCRDVFYMTASQSCMLLIS